MTWPKKPKKQKGDKGTQDGHGIRDQGYGTRDKGQGVRRQNAEGSDQGVIKGND